MTTSAQTSKFILIINWLLVSIFLFYQFFLQTVASVMNTFWMNAFHTSHLGVSNLSSAFFYAYVLMQIPIGIIYDRYQPKPVLSIAALILTIGCLLMAATSNYYVALFARFLMGFGSAFGFIGLLQVIAEWFAPNRFAFVLGLSETFCSLSVTGSVIALAWSLRHFDWRSTMYFCAGIAALLFFAIFFLLRDKEKSKEFNSEINIRTICKQGISVLKTPQVLFASIYAFFMFAIVNAFTSLWGISFLSQVYHVDRQ